VNTDGNQSIRFERVAVLGPVEAALRFTRTARELGDERGRRLHVVALHHDPSRSDAIVRAADSAIPLADGSPDALARALTTADVDALWPGWTAAAEDPATAAVCARLGVRFLGPDAEVLRRVRDRVAVKLIAEGAGRPVVPWNGGALDGPQAAVDAAAALGFPVMLKAACGGGRAGIRRVDDEAELLAAMEYAAADAQASFGDPRLYLEALLVGARHLEVTVVVDRWGNVWTFGPHVATLRRRGDKVVIESAAARLTPADIKSVRGSAATLMPLTGYCGVATVASSTYTAAAHPVSSRSIRDCRPSTPSSRRRPASTSYDFSCMSGSAVASTVSHLNREASPCKPGSTPRTPSGGSRRRRAGWRDCGSGPARASESMPRSPKAMFSSPAAQRWWPKRWHGVRHGTRHGFGCGALSTRRRS
jgi:hypothetical protein